MILRRARLGLTQEQMAERLGTTELEIARIERGQDHLDETTRRPLVQAIEDA